jgi:hypothetical protein
MKIWKIMGICGCIWDIMGIHGINLNDIPIAGK